MTRFLSTVFTLILPFLSFSQTITEEIREEIDRRVSEKINPSLIIGILHEDGLRSYHAYGSYRNDMEVTPDSATHYEIGSVTKTFTAYLVNNYFTQQEAKTLDLFFPGIAAKNTRLKHINIQQLKHHVSGMPRLSDRFAPNNWSDPFKGYGDAQLENELLTVVPDTTAKWSYSNFGYAILGKALEQHTGKDFDMLISEIALQAGMPNTYTAHGPGIDSTMAAPTNLGTTNSFWHFEGPSRYAGGVISTASDLLNYLEYQKAQNDLFGRYPVTGAYPTGINTLGKNQLSYKEGWFVYEPDEYTQILFHNGGTGGYTSFLAYNKRTRTGIVALANSVTLADDIALKILYPGFELKSPERTIAYELAAMIDAGESDKILERYQALKQAEYPNNLVNIYWLERFHYGEKHYEISDKLSTIMLLELPDDWEVLNIKGQNLEKLGNYFDAKLMYESALELNPGRSAIKESITRCEAKLKE